MSTFTAILNAFAIYSKKLDSKKINWGDFVNFQRHLKSIITGYNDNNLTEKEKNNLLEIYYSLQDRTSKFFKVEE